MKPQAHLTTGTTPNWSGGFRRRLPFYLLLALVLALLSGVLVFSYLENTRAGMLPSTNVVVASQALQAGSPITADQVELVLVPEGVLPESAIDDLSLAIGRVPAYPVEAKQVIQSAHFSGAAKAGLSGRLPVDRWALVLPTSWLVGTPPSAQPGDRFDLLAYQPGRPAEEAGLIASDVPLMDGGRESGLLTFAVTFEQASTLLYCRANGFSLLLLLRPGGG